jgi:gliding motility-associated-like protein
MINHLRQSVLCISLLFLSFFANTGRLSAQAFNISITPAVQCFVANTNSALAVVTATAPCATSYSWTILSPTNAGCAPLSTIVPTSSPTNTQLAIFFPCCGVFTINCYGYQSGLPCASVSGTVEVVCATSGTVLGPTSLCRGASAQMTAQPATGNFTAVTWQAQPCGSTVSTIGTGAIIIHNPTVNTTYTAIGTTSQGCIVQATHAIVVTSATIAASPSTQSMCAGNQVCFTATANAINNSCNSPGTAVTGIQWYTPGNNPFGLGASSCTTAAAGNFYVVVTYSGQAGVCTATALSAVIITTAIPMTLSITPSATVCPGATVSVLAVMNPTYSPSIINWTTTTNSFPVTGNPRTFTPFVNTTITAYMLFGTCPGSAQIAVTMASITPTITASSPSICPSTSILLTGSGGNTYTFTGQTLGPPLGSTTVLTKPTFNQGTHTPSFGQFPLNYCVIAAAGGCTGTACTQVDLRTLNPTITALTPSICPGSAVTLSATGGPGTSFTFYSVNNGASIGSLPSSNTTHTISHTPTPFPPAHVYSVTADSAGCVGTSLVDYTVGLLTLTPSVVPSSPSVCPNTTFTITTSIGTATQHIWHSPIPILLDSTGAVNSHTYTIGSSPLTFTVDVDSLGCKGTGTGSVGILDLANTITITPSAYSVCPNTQMTLTAKGASTYTFYFPGTSGPTPTIPVAPASSVAVTPSSLVMTYTVKGDSSTCTGFTTITIQRKDLNPTINYASAANSVVCAGMPMCFTVGGVGTGTMTTFTLVATTPPPPTPVTVTSSSTICVNPTVQTVYTLLSDSAGCISQFPFPTITAYLNPPLSLTATATSASVCSGVSVGLSVAGPTNATYTWFEPNGASSVQIGPPTTFIVVNPTVTTTYTVVGVDPGGCRGTAIVQVGIDPLATLTLNIVGNPTSNTICLAQTMTLTASGAISYSWAPPGGLSTIIGNTVIASPSVTTVYSVTGSNNSGCYGLATYTVVRGVMPSVTITTSSGAVCPGYQATLTAFGANSFTWISSTFSVPVAQQSISVGPGTYTVIASNGGGCVDSTSAANHFTVQLGQPLNIQVSQSTPTTCIESNNPKFSKPVVLTASGAGSYVWFPYNPCCMTYSLGSSTTVRPPATTCFTVTGTTPVCSGSAIVCVTVIPQFTMNVVPPLPAICLGDSLKLSLNNVGPQQLAVGPPSAFTYSWTEALNAPPISISNNLTSTVMIFPKNTTTYTVEMFDSRKCASIPRLVTVTVLPRPVTAIAIPTINGVPTNTVCYVGLYPGAIDNILTLNAINKNTGLPFGILPTYTWTSPYPPKYNSILTPPNNNYVTVNAPLRTPTVVTYMLASGYNGVPGCLRLDTVSIRVVDCRPVYTVNFSTADNNDTICARSCITFINNTDTMAGGPQKLNWTFDGGSPRTSTLQIPTVCYNLPGKYNVILRVENPYPTMKPDGSPPGSTLTAGQLNFIRVVDVPNVTIVKPGQLRSDTTIRFGQAVTLEGSGALSYVWSPAYNISSQTSPVVTVKPFRTTQYILTGYNSGQCSSADTVNVIVIDDCGEMFVPNAFSPNGDGHNDILKVNGICLQSLTFMIFNRWGEKVFETNDQNVGWDGTFAGVEMNTGVFVYRLEGKTYDGKGFTAKGNVTLIR